MKLVLFNDFVPGVLKGDRVVDISSAVEDIPRVNGQTLMAGIIERFDSFRDSIESLVSSSDGVPIDQVRLRAPLPEPGRLVCMAGNYMEGAKLVSDCGDVLEELNLEDLTQPALARQGEFPLYSGTGDSGDPEETALLDHLGEEPLHIDDLGRNAGLPISSVSSLLTMLEIKGMVKQVGCMHYVRTREVSPVYGD